MPLLIYYWPQNRGEKVIPLQLFRHEALVIITTYSTRRDLRPLKASTGRHWSRLKLRILQRQQARKLFWHCAVTSSITAGGGGRDIPEGKQQICNKEKQMAGKGGAQL